MKPMETKDWITLFSATLLALGWFVNGRLNRKNEIAKTRLQYRLPTLKSFLKIWYLVPEMNDPKQLDIVKYKALLTEVREDFQLYGEKDEIELFEEFIANGIGKNLDSVKAKNSLEKLVKLVRERIRKELEIK